MRRRILGVVGSVAVTALLVAIWGAVADARIVSPVFLPSPSRVLTAFRVGLVRGELLEDIGFTVRRMLAGWLLASILAVVAGGLISTTKTLKGYLAPSLEFLRPLPASATIPLFTSALGLTETMIIVSISFGAVWPTLLATVQGFSSIDPRLNEVSGALRLTRTQYLTKIALPSALPDILAGMRLSLTVSLILAIVCEMIAGSAGIGYWILNFGRLFRADNVYAGILILGLIGLLANLAISLIESRALRWRVTQ